MKSLKQLVNHLYKNKSVRSIYEILKKLDFLIYNTLIKFIVWHKLSKSFSRYKIFSKLDTAEKLAHTSKSFARFGDGEMSWILGNHENYNSFENNSKLLSKQLFKVLSSNDRGLMIGVNDALRSTISFTKNARYFWVRYLIKNGNNIVKLLNSNKKYYNSDVSRCYLQYINKDTSIKIFSLFKKIWDGKNILIVEGHECRNGIGIKDDLFDNAKNIKRIECPSFNAFSKYKKIKRITLDFLSNHKSYITLISLGPTATILTYALFMSGYRAIDIGQLDIEYDWYLMGTLKKVNLPYKYVNEVPNGDSVLPISKKYDKEIIYSF